MTKKPENPVSIVVIESLETLDNVERLGRQRPAIFASAWAEVGFCFSVFTTVLMADYFISGFHTILPALSHSLHIPPESYTWPSSVLPLVAGAFLFPLGRLGDMYGGYAVFNLGYCWFTVWCLAAGFCRDYTTLIGCRAMQGLGAAAFLPAGIMLMGKYYRPGPRKNIVFGIYGAVCPIGFFLGIFMGGLAHDTLTWRWYFHLGSIVNLICCVVSFFAVPWDYAAARAQKIVMDWWGTLTTVPGLLLVVFAITNSSRAPRGWATPYIYVTAVLGLLCLAAAVYAESRLAAAPFIPGEALKPKYMKRMIFCLFVSYGVFGIYLFYTNFYIELVLGISPLKTALWFAPWCATGLVLAATSGLILHLVPGRLVLTFCGLSNIVAVLLFALIPERPNYWAHVFPAMIAETACVDILYTVTNVFITTNLPPHHQGLAGAIINATVFLGVSFFLGIADVAVGSTKHMGLSKSYKIVFWIGVGFATLALLVFGTMDIGSAKSDLTLTERALALDEATDESTSGEKHVEAVATHHQ